MNKILKILLLVLIFDFSGIAQNNQLDQANMLFSAQRYSAAQSLYQSMISNNIADEAVYYYHAKCAKELFASDAVHLYQKFLLDFPFTSFRDKVNEDLAFLYLRQKDYTRAIPFLEGLEELDVQPYLMFNLAYAYFITDSLIEAQYYFSKIINIDSKYAPAAQYYSAYIAYRNGFYQSALDGFLGLVSDDQFGAIAPYYITQLYFFQQRYEELILFLVPILDRVVSSRKTEVNRLLAEAYYRTGSYNDAISYFNTYIEQEKDVVSPIDYFLLGQSYFKTMQYKEAVPYLEMASNASDSIVQYAMYCLGASYLKLQQYNYALQAFKKSASYSYDLTIKEDAYYNYAKLSYQLDLPFDNTLDVFRTYLSTYNNELHRKEIESLMVNVFQSSSKYDEALQALKEIELPDYDQKKALQRISFFLGVKEYNKVDYKQAIQYFNLSARYPLNDRISYVNSFWLADCYYQLDDFENARVLYLDLNESNSSGLLFYKELKEYNIGYIYFKQGDYKTANMYFRRYEKIAVDSMRLQDTYLRIADCFFMINEYSLSENYYAKAISSDLFDTDYAIYKRSQALGLVGKNSSKVNLLKLLITDFLTSTYYDNALYDLASYYKNSSKEDLALKYYDKLLLETQEEKLIADAHLSKGMIYFKINNVEQAITEFMFVVDNFPKTRYFKEALAGLQIAYTSLAKVDEYLNIINGLPQVSISQAEQDSLIYNAAFMKFSEADYKVAAATFAKYLDRFESGIFLTDAIYYNAISLVEIGDTASAILMFEQLIDASKSLYQQSALSFLARKHYFDNDFIKSNEYYTKLEYIADNNALKREVLIRLMYGYDKTNHPLAFEYAERVVDLEKKDDWLLSKAKIIIARNEFSEGNYAKSKITFNEVALLSEYDEGAEAKYYLAYLTYLDDNLVLAEKMIFELSEDYNNDHFIAKAFILLADIYVRQNNDFQAKATLESVIENHDGEELVNLARKSWEKIVEREVSNDNSKENIEIYIQIEEEVDYNDFEEFLFEEQDEAYDTLKTGQNDTIELIKDQKQ